MSIPTQRLSADAAGVTRAAGLLSDGALVAFPTETVYGLGALATDDRAVAEIFAAKGRPTFNPLIVHVADVDAARSIAEFGANADRLASAFWPGPLTLVAPVRADSGISRLVTAGLDTVAVRVPAARVAQDLLRAVGGPVAAPSANPSGRVSPTQAQHVLDGLGGRIAAVLDGGPCAVGLESTIIVADPVPQLLRAGGLPVEAIDACLGAPLALPAVSNTVTAPGQLASHYAPAASLRLNATEAQAGETMLGFGAVAGDLTLSRTGDLIEAAANLFGHLHDLDARGVAQIAGAPIPNSGLGRAINDRLARAAAPRG